MERWRIQDESAQGLQLVRGAAEPGKRLAHGQLIGVRPADAKQFMLGQVRWLMRRGERRPARRGQAPARHCRAALAVRPTGLNVTEES